MVTSFRAAGTGHIERSSAAASVAPGMEASILGNLSERITGLDGELREQLKLIEEKNMRINALNARYEALFDKLKAMEDATSEEAVQLRQDIRRLDGEIDKETSTQTEQLLVLQILQNRRIELLELLSKLLKDAANAKNGIVGKFG